MNGSIAERIIQFKGSVFETAGMLSGFFNAPEMARACGQEIERHFGAEVQICGCQVNVRYRQA